MPSKANRCIGNLDNEFNTAAMGQTKETDLDEMVMEMNKAFDDFGIEKLTILGTEIYDTRKCHTKSIS